MKKPVKKKAAEKKNSIILNRVAFVRQDKFEEVMLFKDKIAAERYREKFYGRHSEVRLYNCFIEIKEELI